MWNNSTKLVYCFFLALLCGLWPASASAKTDSATTAVVIPLDSSKTDVRKLSAEQKKKLSQNKDYLYDRVGPAPETIWDRFVQWFWDMISKIFSTKAGEVGWTIFKYALIAAVVVIGIILLVKNDVRSVLYGKSAAVHIDFKEFDDDINKINFEEMIADALAKKDYRKAVRLHFLKLLKELTDKNLIKWQLDKTNNDYSIELANSKYSRVFDELTVMYEYIWYGDFNLDETNFMATITKFKEFHV